MCGIHYRKRSRIWHEKIDQNAWAHGYVYGNFIYKLEQQEHIFQLQSSGTMNLTKTDIWFENANQSGWVVTFSLSTIHPKLNAFRPNHVC